MSVSITPIPHPDHPDTTLLVELGDDHVVYKRFRARTTHDGLEVELDVEVDHRGQPQCRALKVSADEVTGRALRGIPVGRLLAEAATAATAAWKPPEKRSKTEPIEPWMTGREYFSTPRTLTRREQLAVYERFAGDARVPRRGSPLSDENLRQVAELYRAAVERGDPPTQTVADVMDVARSTAARWVTAARERELLGPAMRGRGGEATDNPKETS